MTENWHSGIDGGEWEYCPTCTVSTPPTEQGTCATCGTVIVDPCGPDCRCAPCLRQQDVFWTAYDIAVRTGIAELWVKAQQRTARFPAHLIAEAARKIAEAA